MENDFFGGSGFGKSGRPQEAITNTRNNVCLRTFAYKL